ncbi:MAG: CocE/NonD family hydrolase, partial [Planctomycetota bacterium]
MRDGVRLAVDVHLPKGLAAGERTATILHMSRYYRSIDIRGLWRPLVGFGIYAITERDIRKDFVKAGYSWVDVDVRGAGASFGHREYPLSDEEVRDGADVLDWIVAQPWSAGVVGATGASYDGALATLLLRNHHPALKAIVPRFSGWDAYGDIFLPGGVPATPLLHAWARLTSALDHDHLSNVLGWSSGLFSSGVRPVDRALLPQAMAEHDKNVDLVQLLGGVVYRDDTDPRGRPVTTDDFSPHTLGREVADVPIYAYAGWFDGALPRGQIHQYLANRNPGSRLRLGPWFHAG